MNSSERVSTLLNVRHTYGGGLDRLCNAHSPETGIRNGLEHLSGQTYTHTLDSVQSISYDTVFLPAILYIVYISIT